MEKVFAYGTLQDTKVLMKIIGRVPNNTNDSLTGFKMSKVSTDEGTYPIIIEDISSKEVITGIVLEVSNDELEKLDEYEGDEYKRVKIILSSGCESWVYKK